MVRSVDGSVRLLRLATAIFIAASLAFGAASVRAQEYRFAVPSLKLEATIQKDGSARLDYAILFANSPTGHDIDIVDVGLPHDDYESSTMTASLDGAPSGDIRPSTYIDTGVECHLSPPLPAGQTGTFRFSGVMPDMVYQDTTNDDLASFRIKPTWFDPASTLGTTHLQIAVHLPPGMNVDELKYQSEEMRYSDVAVLGEGEDQHLVAFWDFPDIALSADNPTVAVSFPKRTVDQVIEQTLLDLAWLWWKNSAAAQFISGCVLVIAWWVIYLRFANGTGWIVGLIVMGGMIWLMVVSPAWHLLLYPIVGCVGALNEWALSYVGKTRTYLPAMATVEGGGIKRGLTAPLAAALLERPLGVVATLTIFGLLKKGILEMTSTEPPTAVVAEPYRKARQERLKAASKLGTVIHAYEQPFLDVLQSHSGPLPAADLRAPLKELLESLAGQLKGFDLSQTQEYYRRIVERAWKEAESLGQLDQKREAIDRNFEWLAMEPDWTGRLGRSGGPQYHPGWWRTGPAMPSSPSVPSPAPSSTPDVSLGDVAGSFTGWMENRAGSLVSSIEPVSLGLDLGDGKGLIDLTGVDTMTADVFDALASSKGGGGGGGGGGCACAGCACACACAGGGR